MHNVSSIISMLGGNAAVAKRLGKGDSAVSEMKRRESIPVDYWQALIEMAAELGVGPLNADVLLEAHSAKEAEA